MCLVLFWPVVVRNFAEMIYNYKNRAIAALLQNLKNHGLISKMFENGIQKNQKRQNLLLSMDIWILFDNVNTCNQTWATEKPTRHLTTLAVVLWLARCLGDLGRTEVAWISEIEICVGNSACSLLHGQVKWILFLRQNFKSLF